MKFVDNIKLDDTNIEFNQADEAVKQTDKLLYITGKAGTGKTTFLKYIKETTNKKMVILAPTGIAAINAGGQTIHSFFHIKPSIYVPNDHRLSTNYFHYTKETLDIIKELELLIIDEISMVRCDLLDVIDTLLRVFRKISKPFGGVQVVLVGDTFQLPPIANVSDWDILKKDYDSPFFFSSKVILSNPLIYIELKKIYRQNEQEFIDLLNKVRINNVNEACLNLINSRFDPTFSQGDSSNYITLATHNKVVDDVNLNKLASLPGESKIFQANITGIFPDTMMPTNNILQLKEGAQIMFVKNDLNQRYYNGKIAKIKKLDENNIIIELAEDDKIILERRTWKNIVYSWNKETKRIEEETVGTFSQYPIRLAWAITVHKSQGLTFDKVIADLGRSFTSGQVYVALSRCSKFSGLVLKTKIESHAIITDPKVLDFAKKETPDTLILKELTTGKADFLYKRVRDDLFKRSDFEGAYFNFIRAIKLRNDIETNEFKRYFIMLASKLSSYRNQYIKEHIKYTDITKSTILMKNEISDLSDKNNNLTIELDKCNNNIQSMLSEIDELKNTNKELEAAITIIESYNSGLHYENYTKQQQLTANEDAIKSMSSKIKELEQQNNIKNDEIERLRNLKWYQKLIGQK